MNPGTMGVNASAGNFSEQNLGYGHKKRSSAELQPFVNLKSNTMKNTLQR